MLHAIQNIKNVSRFVGTASVRSYSSDKKFITKETHIYAMSLNYVDDLSRNIIILLETPSHS